MYRALVIKGLGAQRRRTDLWGGMIHTLKTDVQERYKKELDFYNFLTPWLVRHSSWLITCYLRLRDGHNAFYQINGEEHHSVVVPFGETVMVKMPGPATEQDGSEMAARHMVGSK